jgi:hypothetical protein
VRMVAGIEPVADCQSEPKLSGIRSRIGAKHGFRLDQEPVRDPRPEERVEERCRRPRNKILSFCHTYVFFSWFRKHRWIVWTAIRNKLSFQNL